MKDLPAASAAKVLTESEIQQKLYGAYHRGKHRVPPPPPALPSDSEWNGQEILSGELERLRSELIELRQEKERLSQRLTQISPPPSAPVAPPGEQQVVWASSSAWKSGWGSRLILALMVMGLGGYWMGGRILQASPMAAEPTPFTVQVAVYDGKTPARLAADFLSGLSYGAFVVELPRKSRGTRYRVCVGSFVTREEANLERLRLVGDPRFPHFKDAFVVRSR